MIHRLSGREKLFVFSGIAMLLLLGFWLGVYTPYRQGIIQVEARIASRQRQLDELRRLQQDYRRLQQELAAAEQRMKSSTQGFSLFSFIEDVTTRTGVRENLVSMRPQTTQAQGEFQEESVEVRLERVQLEQLVGLLHAVESADLFLRMKSLRAKSRFDNRAQLDAVLLVSSFQKAT